MRIVYIEAKQREAYTNARSSCLLNVVLMQAAGLFSFFFIALLSNPSTRHLPTAQALSRLHLHHHITFLILVILKVIFTILRVILGVSHPPRHPYLPPFITNLSSAFRTEVGVG